jgi:hypothetical protein
MCVKAIINPKLYSITWARVTREEQQPASIVAHLKDTHDKSKQIAEANNFAIPISSSCVHMTYKQSQFVIGIGQMLINVIDAILNLVKRVL